MKYTGWTSQVPCTAHQPVPLPFKANPASHLPCRATQTPGIAQWWYFCFPCTRYAILWGPREKRHWWRTAARV